MMYGLETVSTSKVQAEELEAAEISMLRFALGVKRLDGIRTKRIIRMTCLGKILSQVKCENSVVWSCIVVKRENCVGQSLLRFEVSGKKEGDCKDGLSM